MAETSIAEAKNQLTRLIHQAERGDTVHITRRGRPVAVLLSEAEYARLSRGAARPTFWEAIQAMRADPDFEPQQDHQSHQRYEDGYECIHSLLSTEHHPKVVAYKKDQMPVKSTNPKH